jgi:hypothetical protein
MSVITAIRATYHAADLDAELAAGAAPDSSPELDTRAQRLTNRASRATLATRLEKAVELPEASRYGSVLLRSAVVDPPPAVAEFAGPAVRRLAHELRAAEHPDPRGVALARRLLTDGSSPLYRGPTADEVLGAVQEIEAAL